MDQTKTTDLRSLPPILDEQKPRRGRGRPRKLANTLENLLRCLRMRRQGTITMLAKEIVINGDAAMAIQSRYRDLTDEEVERAVSYIDRLPEIKDAVETVKKETGVEDFTAQYFLILRTKAVHGTEAERIAAWKILAPMYILPKPLAEQKPEPLNLPGMREGIERMGLFEKPKAEVKETDATDPTVQ